MKRSLIIGAAALMLAAAVLPIARLAAQETVTVPKLQYRAIYDFFRSPPDMNFGEVLGVAVNSKGNLVVLNHPGTATSGPLYGNATTQLLRVRSNGRFVREMGQGRLRPRLRTFGPLRPDTTTCGWSTKGPIR